jgi:ribosome-binding factor A
MPGEPGMRAKRVGEGVREELATLVAHELKDPRAAGAVVTGVEMTGDLRSARVRVRLLAGGEDLEGRRRLVEALGRASGMLRREVTQRLRLRTAPELKFVYDDGADRSTRVEEILAEIEADKRGRGRG